MGYELRSVSLQTFLLMSLLIRRYEYKHNHSLFYLAIIY